MASPRAYALTGSVTNTAAVTQVVLVSTSAIRPAVYDMLISASAAPADNAAQYQVKRFTAAGTTTALTPQALDSGDPAATATAGTNASIEPTYTANAILLTISANQRTTARWLARDRGELICPATAANGLGLFSNAVGGSAFAAQYTVHFSEG